jgi:hypothetical protein
MNGFLVLSLIIIVLIGVGLLVLITATRGRRSGLDRAKYQEAWLKLENNLDAGNVATYQFAVLNADKLLDSALKDLGVAGDTMGERLKNSRGKFAGIDDVWRAHKLRNQIAHEPDTRVNVLGAKRALAIFKKALKELGAI